MKAKSNDHIVMRLPNPHLDIRMDIKSPGLTNNDLEEATLTHAYPQDRSVDGYEKLLHDAIESRSITLRSC